MPVLVETEVGGIQKFITGTGKLKEMIGGSEIVHFICQGEFYEPVLHEIGCARVVEDKSPGDDWHAVLQNNAGVLCLILPNEQKGRAFLEAFSRKSLENFPGLPLFGAQTPVEWDMQALDKARAEAERLLNTQRMSMPVPAGPGMLPILRAARLDGLPAVEMARAGDGREEAISLPSLCRRNRKMLKRSEERLRKYAGTPEGVIWANDLEVMLPDGGMVALIHLDGNDMGKLFNKIRNERKNDGVAEFTRKMRDLSRSIEEINIRSFAHAAGNILDYILQFERGERPVMPIRPLVMGGDDITLVARADMALPFIDLFASRYEDLAARNNLPLSLGIGMVVMSSSYPFARAFPLVDELAKSAKKLTMNQAGKRKSSIDYLVLTEEVENSLDDLRARIFTAADGSILTGKPFLLAGSSLVEFMERGWEVLHELPRSALRPALADCRRGKDVARKFWLNTRENLARGLGGRLGKLMKGSRFEQIFPENFFTEIDGKNASLLGDYLELGRLMPSTGEKWLFLRNIMLKGREKNV